MLWGVLKDIHFESLHRSVAPLLVGYLPHSELNHLAVVTACLGVFGVVTFATERRTKEIGIRKVVGAPVVRIVGLLSREMLALVLVANLVAWAVAWWGMELYLKGFAYRVELGPQVFILAAGVSLGLAWVAMCWQTIRASLANPVESRRYE